MAKRFDNPTPQFGDSAGESIAGARLFFFESGTSTPLDTFTSEALTTANPNPVVCDADGRLPNVFLKPFDYKVTLKEPAEDVTIWERDPVFGANETFDEIKLKDFGAVGDGVTDDTTAVSDAIAATPAGGTLFCALGTYLVDGNTLTRSLDINITGEPGTTFKLATTTGSEVLLATGGSTTRISLESITFDVNQATTDAHTNVMFRGSALLSLDVRAGCRFINSASSAFPAANWGSGIFMLGSYGRVTIHDGVHFERHRAGFITDKPSTGKDVIIGAITFKEMSGECINIDVPSGSCENVSVTGASCKDVGRNVVGAGFFFASSGNSTATSQNIRLVGCSAEGVDVHAIHIEKGSRRVTISDFTAESCGEAAATTLGAAISIANGSGSHALDGVTMTNIDITGGPNSDFGIDYGGSNDAGDFILSNYIIRDIGNGPGLRVNSANENVILSNGIIKNSNGVAQKLQCDHLFMSNIRCYDDQGSPTQTYGGEFLGSMVNPSLRDINFDGNINKGWLRTGVASPVMTKSADAFTAQVQALAASSSAATDMIDLSEGATGELVFTAINGTNRATHIYTIAWTGPSATSGSSTLVATQISDSDSGTIDISDVETTALTMNGTVLQGTFFNSSGGTVNADIQMQFTGLIMLK